MDMNDAYMEEEQILVFDGMQKKVKAFVANIAVIYCQLVSALYVDR